MRGIRFCNNSLRRGVDARGSMALLRLPFSFVFVSMLFVTPFNRIAFADEKCLEPVAEGFEYPLPWLKTASVRQRIDFESHRNRMLKFGWDPKAQKSLATAEFEFAAASKLCSDDPRLEYAFGLVLWNQGQLDQAIKRFDSAAHLNDGRIPFLPSAHAAAWGRLLTNQRQAGWNHLVAVASVLGNSKGDYPTRLQKEFSALSLGRAVGFLTGPGRCDKTAAYDALQAEEISNAIPLELSGKFVTGRQQTRDRHEQLMKLASLPTQVLEAELQQKQAAAKAKIDESKSDLAGLKSSLEKTSKEHRKWLSEQERKLEQCEQAAPPLQNGILWANAQLESHLLPQRHFQQMQQSFLSPASVRYVTSPDRGKDNKNDKLTYETVSVVVERGETPCEYQLRMYQCAVAAQACQTLTNQLNRVVDEHRRLDQERLTTKKAHRAKSCELRSQNSQELRAQRESQTALINAQKELVLRQMLRDQVSTIAPYVAWNLETEREFLLQSYRITLASSGK